MDSCRVGGRCSLTLVDVSRPYKPFALVPSESLSPGLDRLLADPIPSGVLERSFEYRLVWDEDRQAWRVDRRTRVPGY